MAVVPPGVEEAGVVLPVVEGQVEVGNVAMVPWYIGGHSRGGGYGNRNVDPATTTLAASFLTATLP